jgi:hypothetical protein
MIKNRLSWQNHMDMMIPKLNSATYVIRSLKPLLNIETLNRPIFHLPTQPYPMVLHFGEFQITVKLYLKIQKSMIRIIMNVDNRSSCRNLFKQLNILPLKSQYIFSFP